MAMHGDKREDESIRVHRQLPVCQNDPFFSFELHRGRAGNCHCDLNVAACYSTIIFWMFFGINDAMRFPVGLPISLICYCDGRGTKCIQQFCLSIRC